MAAIGYSFQPVSATPSIGGGRLSLRINNPLRSAHRQAHDNSPDDLQRAPASSVPNSGLKTKWKSFVHFFALPIRQYYQHPPGSSFRQRHTQRASNRRGSLFLEGEGEYDDSIGAWACPTYNYEVGDDEMTLIKSAEARQEAQSAFTSSLHVGPPVTSVISQNGSDGSRPANGVPTPTGLTQASHQRGPRESTSIGAVGDGTIELAANDVVTPADIGEHAPEYEVLSSPSTPVFPSLEGTVSPTLSSAAFVYTGREEAGGSILSLNEVSSMRPRAFHHSLSNLGLVVPARTRPRTSPSRPSFLRRLTHGTPDPAGPVFASTANASSPAEGEFLHMDPSTASLLFDQHPLPRQGLTAAQLSFLRSSESLVRYGLPTPLGATSQPDTPRPAATAPTEAAQTDYFGPRMVPG